MNKELLALVEAAGGQEVDPNELKVSITCLRFSPFTTVIFNF